MQFRSDGAGWEGRRVIYGGGSCGADNDVWCTASTSSANGRSGVIARSSGSNTDYHWNFNGSAGYEMGKLIGGVYTSLGTGLTGCGPGVWKLRCNGTTLTGYLGDVQKKQVTDSENQSNTIGGLYMSGTGGAGSNHDDWGLSDIPACPLLPADPGRDDIEWLWVRIKGDGTPTAPYAPDIPAGIEWDYDDSVMTDTGGLIQTAMCIGVAAADAPKITTVTPSERDKLLWDVTRKLRRNAYFVPTGIHPPSEAHTADHTWPSRDVTGGKVYYRPRPWTSVTESEIAAADAAGTLAQLCGAYDDKAEAFFDSIPNMTGANAARKRMVADILDQAKERGLSVDRAEQIRVRHNLPAQEGRRV